MAATINLDASEIIAKLHLGGRESSKLVNIFNTGILNDNPTATPKNPGKVSFDLTSKDGIYEVGVYSTIEYIPEIPIEEDSKDKDSKEDNKDSKDKEEDKDSKEEDKDSKEDLEKIKKENESNKAEYEKLMNTFKSDALESISKYLINFMGKDKAPKLSADKLFLKVLSDKVKDKKPNTLQIKDFRVLPINEKELEKKKEANNKNIIKNHKYKTSDVYCYSVLVKIVKQ